MSKSLSSRKRFESGLLPAVYSVSSLQTHQITGFAPAPFITTVSRRHQGVTAGFGI